ncbi:hypothetical protein AB0D38_05375 [Streptomyces sp. NPDC048279]|uniref:hypothetical protein n=1 Tax=Streptomyces sp. NPDC048279 TaxID=3154714 RepID=UPI00343FA801
MTHVSDDRNGLAATVVALTAEAAGLQTRIDELREELTVLNERMAAISAALPQPPSR